MADKPLVLRLSDLVSLDVVPIEKDRRFLVVLAERGRVQRRTLVQIDTDQADKLMRFLHQTLQTWRLNLRASVDAELGPRESVVDTFVEEITDLHVLPLKGEDLGTVPPLLPPPPGGEEDE